MTLAAVLGMRESVCFSERIHIFYMIVHNLYNIFAPVILRTMSCLVLSALEVFP